MYDFALTGHRVLKVNNHCFQHTVLVVSWESVVVEPVVYTLCVSVCQFALSELSAV